MILPPFFLSPSGIMVAIVAALSLSNFVTYKLWRSEVHEYAQFRTDVETQSELLKAEADRAKAERERVSAETAQGWSAAVDYWKRHGGVRVSADCHPASLPAVGTTATGTHAPSAESGSGADRTITAAQCEAIANKAVRDAAQVVWLQSWARKQHEVKP